MFNTHIEGDEKLLHLYETMKIAKKEKILQLKFRFGHFLNEKFIGISRNSVTWHLTLLNI
jgi:hypothetical protein